jgi:hypothetical protein
MSASCSAEAGPGLIGGSEDRSACGAGKDVDVADPLLDRSSIGSLRTSGCVMAESSDSLIASSTVRRAGPRRGSPPLREPGARGHIVRSGGSGRRRRVRFPYPASLAPPQPRSAGRLGLRRQEALESRPPQIWIGRPATGRRERSPTSRVLSSREPKSPPRSAVRPTIGISCASRQPAASTYRSMSRGLPAQPRPHLCQFGGIS